MKLQALTEEQIRNHINREYNPKEWDKTIDRFKKYESCQFYIEVDGLFSYPRFFATYKLPEGFSVLNNVSYSTSLSNTGFVAVSIAEDGTVITTKFSDGKKEGRAENCPQNRAMFARKGLMVTACL